ncbi:MAG: PocR ligand-binding domain-containing protein [Candidatus Sedimenticola sp. 6PFRAG7]
MKGDIRIALGEINTLTELPEFLQHESEKYRTIYALLRDLLASEQITQLLGDFRKIVGISWAVIDLQANVLASSKWQRICTEFHRVNSSTCERCIESDTELANQLEAGEQFTIYRCRNGLTDCASPIVIDGEHVANLFMGQFMLQQPDPDFFRRQAEEFGFDTDDYLAALTEVPIVDESKIPNIMSFLAGFAELIARIGLEKLTQQSEALVRRQLESQVGERTAELQQANAVISADNQRFEAVMDEMNSVVYVADMETYELLFINQFGKKVFGDVVGQTCWKVLQIDQTGPCPFCTNRRLLDDQGNPTGALIWEFQNSITNNWYQCSDQAIRWPDGRIVRMEVATDITELKVLENSLSNAKEAAEASNWAKSLFLANMSHELRTPLNAVLGFSQLMSNDQTLSPQHKSNLEIINRSGHHLLQLINDVLDMSKIESGKTQLEPEDIDLSTLILDVTDMMQIQAEEKGLQLLLDQSSDFPRYVRADGPKIRQILINLLSNSIKFTDQGGLTLRLAASSNQSDSITLKCEVQDTGRGISPEDIERIFQPFEQLVSAIEQKGTGLGLAITRQFVELMGGEISAASQPGKGSTFTFSIQVEPGNPEQVQIINGKETRRVIGLQDTTQAWRILIAEDQLENQLLLQQLLESVGFEVRIAEDGEKTVAIFNEWHPHFIWMDRRMPRMDGLTATRKIRELPGGDEVKIAALTASVFKEQKDEVMAAGSDDFVRKPYRPDEIFDCMARHLDLDYIYEEETSVSTEVEGEPPALTAEQLSALPAELRDALNSAVTLLDVNEMREVVKRIEAIDSDLAGALAQRVEAFDFTAIKQLFQSGRDADE